MEELRTVVNPRSKSIERNVVANHGIKRAKQPEVAEPFEISANTLRMIDGAVENLKRGKVSEPVDL